MFTNPGTIPNHAQRSAPADQSVEHASNLGQSAVDDELLESVAEEFGLTLVDLEHELLDPDLIDRFPSQKLFEFEMLPLRTEGEAVLIATSDPLAMLPLDELACYSGLRLEPVLARRDVIRRYLRELLGVGGGTVGQLAGGDSELENIHDDQGGEEADDARSSFVVKLVNELLTDAVNQHASDIHLEPEGQSLAVRFRVDGLLRLQPVPNEIHRFRAAIVSRLKIMAKLNIAEKRLPQDGRFQMTVAGRPIDVRISIIPMLAGEGIVMRLLDQSRSSFDLNAVSFASEMRERWERLIRRPHGMVLVTGPTGSGKTTTLYSSLVDIRSPNKKIITVEDPVEYQLPGISQIQVRGQIGLDFAAGLRSILRHDPDVVLIGEIRDTETARSAVQASLTGHLVLSTLHTNDAASAYTRLVDMGLEEYLVASTVQAVLAQRLVRRICPECREQYEPDLNDLPSDFPQDSPATFWRGRGCRRCHQTGYSGRVAVFELLETEAEIRQLCLARASSCVIQQQALRNGMSSLRESGWSRVLNGETTLEEVARVCCTDD